MNARILLFFLLVLIGLALLSVTMGRYDFSPVSSVTQLLRHFGWLSGNIDPMMTTIMLDVRLPRVIAAILIGAALAVSGTAFQAMFMNPLVSPGILGVLSGSAFGASLGILWFDSLWMMQLFSFLFGMAAVLVTLLLASNQTRNNLTLLVLGGMISGALFSALLSIVKYVADPYDKLPAIVYWLMGSLANVQDNLLIFVAPFILFGIILMALQGHTLNLLSLGEDEAKTLGVSVETKRFHIIILATFLAAITVSLGGMIGWVGLVIPHVARLLLGADNRLLLPASALLGGIYLLMVDNLARLMLSIEIPLGILTALIGLPVFAWALRNVNKGWSNT
ncbi:iron ABC transporter permease [Hydrogenovibrio sp. JE_KL2]|jgi:iron complex transport system permease protein|uniref:FecCD family ABC transporter permease n=1 Tax=Hydrogenovibrio sp. JE_KL2 TaxID=2651188 RepID=UPI00128BD79A|nr:iron ABC transporter permease [Hydrogenovibrio sp. JE_KL2]MBD3820704.1 iron ABC transporter permease [Thiotrichales bacterium]MPQ76348.1 iron ABC transporter permease [Hydrogenovibrio sp. JE_KL2]